MLLLVNQVVRVDDATVPVEPVVEQMLRTGVELLALWHNNRRRSRRCRVGSWRRRLQGGFSFGRRNVTAKGVVGFAIVVVVVVVVDGN